MKHEPTYTHDWISPYFPLWDRLLPKSDTLERSILEIGCFEGRATAWFLQRYPMAYLTCVDTFEGGQDHKELGIDFTGTEAQFRHNTRPLNGRITLHIRTSKQALHWLTDWTTDKATRDFDIILVDGSHVACDVLSDAVLGWWILRSGGIMIFDDYGWSGGRPPEQTPAPAIDSFLACYKGQYEALEQGYQVIVRKL